MKKPQQHTDLDLQASYVADGKAKDAADSHEGPEVAAVQVLEVDDDRHLAEDDHEGDKEDAGVDVVVKGQRPDVALAGGKVN